MIIKLKMDHPHPVDLKRPKLWEAYKGEMIVVGDAEKPNTKWNCHPKHVYRVWDADILQDRGVSSAFICDHMIESIIEK